MVVKHLPPDELEVVEVYQVELIVLAVEQLSGACYSDPDAKQSISNQCVISIDFYCHI